jgi:hypothetical protein
VEGANAGPKAVYRRFSDPVSDLNAQVWDKSRLLARAVEMVDGLGIQILSAEADNSRNSRILVVYSRECAALEGIEIKRSAEYSHWMANRFGVEIHWVIGTREAA